MKIKKEIVSFEKKRFNKHYIHLLIALFLTILSFFLTLVPCTIIENKSSFFGFCKLPNPLVTLDNLNYFYYNYSNNPISGLIFQFLTAILISYLIVYLFKQLNFKRKNHRVLDLTSKSGI